MLKPSAIGKTTQLLLHLWSTKVWSCLHPQHHLAGTSMPRRAMKEMLNAIPPRDYLLNQRPNATGKTTQTKQKHCWHKDYNWIPALHHSLTTIKWTKKMSIETWNAMLLQLSQTVIAKRAQQALETLISVHILDQVKVSILVPSSTMAWQALIQHAKTSAPTREEWLSMEATISLTSKVINILQKCLFLVLEIIFTLTEWVLAQTCKWCCETKLKINLSIK